MHKLFLKMALLTALLISTCSFVYADAPAPLSSEQAFEFSAYLSKPNQLIVEWHIAPGHHLYRDKLRITAIPTKPTRIGAIEWPASQTRTDAERGPYRIYVGDIKVTIPLVRSIFDPLTLTVQYQGCSDSGYCYAPAKKLLHLTFPFESTGLDKTPLITISDASTALTSQLVTNQVATQSILSNHTFFMTILSFLGLGLLLAFTPCSLPMIPILSSIIVGQHNLTTRKAFYLSLTYVLGTAVTYALAGIAIAWIGSSVAVYFQNPWVIIGFSTLFAVLAFSMLGLFDVRSTGVWQRKIIAWQHHQKGAHYLGVFLMGCLSTLIVSPCVTAPLVGVLAYITESGNVVLGGCALFALGLGMGLPLLLLGFSAGKYLPKAGPWMEIVKKFFAFLLLGMAVWMLSRILPGEVTLFLWACLLIMTAAYFLFFMEAMPRMVRFLSYSTGALFIVYGFLLFVGVSLSYTSPLYPLEKLGLIAPAPTTASLNFTVIKDMHQLQALLAQAKFEKKPVMLDFYAEWCETCRAIDKALLSHPEVRLALQPYVLLRANVSENNAFDKKLLKRYGVVAPPTFLFFNRAGKELLEQRIVGEPERQVFISHINAAQ